MLQWKLAQFLTWFGLETSPVKVDNTPHFELNLLENTIIQEKQLQNFKEPPKKKEQLLPETQAKQAIRIKGK